MTEEIKFEDLFSKPKPKIDREALRKSIRYFGLACILSAIGLSIFFTFYFPAHYKGESMDFPENSAIFCRKIPYEDLKLGDVITYKINSKNDCTTEGNCIIHRVYYIGEDYLITKGDNNNYVDSVQVTKENYVARC